MTTPKFSDVHVPMVGEDGNAFAILGRVTKALRKAGVSEADVAAYMTEATSGDYDNLIQVTFATVECD